MFAFRKSLILSILCLLIALQMQAYAVKGVLDLRLETFQSPVSLEGQWEFYWKQILTADDQFDAQTYAEFPQIWNGQVISGETISSQGFATYRLKIILPPKVQDYELFIDDMYCSYTVFVEGEEIASNGVVGADITSSKPQWKPQVVELPNQSGIIEVVLNISNWRHSKGGSLNPIKLSKAGVLSSIFYTNQRLQTALFVLFLLVSIYFFYRFAFKSYDLTSFYFGLFIVIYSYRMIGADFYLLHQWIDGYPWLVGVKLEYLSLFLSTIAFAMYVYHMYSEESSFQYVKPLLIICSAFSVLVIITPVAIFSRSLLIFFGVLILYIAYGFYVFTSAAINGRKGSTFGVLSVSVVFISFIYQIFYYIGWLEYVYIVTFISHALFIIFQTIQLFIISEANLKSIASTDR